MGFQMSRPQPIGQISRRQPVAASSEQTKKDTCPLVLRTPEGTVAEWGPRDVNVACASGEKQTKKREPGSVSFRARSVRIAH